MVGEPQAPQRRLYEGPARKTEAELLVYPYELAAQGWEFVERLFPVSAGHTVEVFMTAKCPCAAGEKLFIRRMIAVPELFRHNMTETVHHLRIEMLHSMHFEIESHKLEGKLKA